MDNDKQTEYRRYDARAQAILAADNVAGEDSFGSMAIPPVFRAPYLYYEHCIHQYISKNHHVLEIGSGTGLHTYALAQTGARVVASDISVYSLSVLERRIKEVRMVAADMEACPFKSESFDVVASAGSLSYGDPELVDREVRRVLRPGGTFICVDSLNHNPIYRLNRWFHYLRGVRTKSTIDRMPTMGRIESISKGFRSTEVRYFGAMSYLMLVLARIIGQNHAARLSDVVDRIVHCRRSAFKFVLVARERL